MNKILGIVVLGFLLSVNAFAKTSNLKDINTFQLSINEFDKCDVDTDDLKTSAKYVAVIAFSKLKKLRSYKNF